MKFKSEKKTNLRIVLLLVALVVIVLIMVVFAYLYSIGLVSVLFLSGSEAATINAAKNVCVERGCVLAAAEIINSLDEKVDPCTGKR